MRCAVLDFTWILARLGRFFLPGSIAETSTSVALDLCLHMLSTLASVYTDCSLDEPCVQKHLSSRYRPPTNSGKIQIFG
ncbi:hypothetical protein F5890DRAFT_1512964 [Lentinula detonsa]|uniref:Secreted protein n=1 Tax=Lentinula detonsa TaxID=2804962 RepID=A0AA38Q1C1_9AGAR|nr:hypothetical protein F5890DRAFT_1512964 [Lentinula detonsa]